MHGRIECWHCGDVKEGCRCLQHEHVVVWETCVICKSKAGSQSHPPQKTKYSLQREDMPSPMKIHHFEIKPRDPTKMLTGSNTILLMDGVPVKGCCSFKFEVQAAEVAKVTIEMIGTFAMAAEIGEIETKIIPLVPQEKTT